MITDEHWERIAAYTKTVAHNAFVRGWADALDSIDTPDETIYAKREQGELDAMIYVASGFDVDVVKQYHPLQIIQKRDALAQVRQAYVDGMVRGSAREFTTLKAIEAEALLRFPENTL